MFPLPKQNSDLELWISFQVASSVRVRIAVYSVKARSSEAAT